MGSDKRARTIDTAALMDRVCRAQAASVARLSDPVDPAEFERVLEELHETWEELMIATEELRAQNDELAAAHETLQRSRRRYRNLFDFGPDACVLTDAGGIVRETNAAALRLLQTNARYLIGKPLIIFVPVEHRPTFRRA